MKVDEAVDFFKRIAKNNNFQETSIQDEQVYYHGLSDLIEQRGNAVVFQSVHYKKHKRKIEMEESSEEEVEE